MSCVCAEDALSTDFDENLNYCIAFKKKKKKKKNIMRTSFFRSACDFRNWPHS